jgi:hypothetical protein
MASGEGQIIDSIAAAAQYRFTLSPFLILLRESGPNES